MTTVQPVQLNLRREMHLTGEDDKTGQTNTAIIEFTGMNINHVEDFVLDT